jgi:hypothetical protein
MMRKMKEQSLRLLLTIILIIKKCLRDVHDCNSHTYDHYCYLFLYLKQSLPIDTYDLVYIT